MKILFGWFVLIIPLLGVAQNPLVPEEVARTATFNENPVFDSQGNLYVSEPYRGPITKITPEGDVSVWADLGGAVGHKILRDGSHLVCDIERRAILKLDAAGKVMSQVVTDCGGQPLRIPNDLALDTQGGFYFTDSRTQEDSVGRVGYVDKDGHSHLLAEWVGLPNGIALRPDEKMLYVSDFDHNTVLAFPVSSPGTVGPEKVFARLPTGDNGEGAPDGIAFDAEGNLYVAHLGMGQVQVLNPQGKLIRSLPAGQEWVSNLCFGGPDGQMLYMTGCPQGQLRQTGIVYKLDLSEVATVAKE